MNGGRILFIAFLLILCTELFAQNDTLIVDNVKKVEKLMSEYKFDEALMVIDSVEIDKNFALLKSSCLKKLYRYDEAITFIQEWNTQYMENGGGMDARIMTELADCYSVIGNFNDAYPIYEFLTQAYPLNFYYALQKCFVLYRLEDYPKAIYSSKMFLQIIKPNYPPVLSIIGNSFNKMGIVDSALVYYDQILSIFPDDVQSIDKKSNILFGKKRQKEVITLTEDYLQRDSTNLLINSINGLAYHLDGAYEKSLSTFLRQQSLGDDSFITNYYIGLNYYLLNQKFKAEPFFANAYSMDSTNVNLVYYYASSKSWQEYKFDEAKMLYDRAISLMTDSVMLYKVYGGYAADYFRIKDYKSSLKYYELSVKYNPRFYSAIASIGYCYEKLKDYRNALKNYKKYQSHYKEGSKEFDMAQELIDGIAGEEFMNR